jgi:CubicO group peptidase (beta-lactamase class C family)
MKNPPHSGDQKMKTKIVRVISVLLLVTIFISAASRPGSASALSQITDLEQTATQPAGPIDPQELETFLDGLLAAEMVDKHIPATFPEPITLRHLMSHTPGFEFKGTNLYGLQAERMSPLGDWLVANLPARVFPPGEVAVYSNYGAALAGYIVERVSGLPFNDYVEQNILAPLGMAHSTFRQPLPENLTPDMAKGYHYSNEYNEGGFMFMLSPPGGALSATATEMTRFMIAHLQNGELDGRRIMQEETAHQMHSQLYSPDPRLESMARGFFEKTENGQRLIFHTGGLTQFHSGLWLLPEQNVGLFFSTNSTGGLESVEAVKKAFLDHYYPVAELPDPQSAAGFAERIAPYLGQYTSAQSSFTTSEKIYGAFSPISASLNSDGTLVISQPGLVQRFAEVEPGLLQEIGDPDNQWVYGTGPGGRLFLMEPGPYPLFRTPWYGTSNLHLSLFLGGTLLFLGALIAWPIGFLWWRKQSPASQTAPLPARLARWAAALFGLLWLLDLLGIMSIFMDILPETGGLRIIYEAVPLLNILLSLSYVLVGLALAILVLAVLAWVRRYWNLDGRIFYTLLALMALLLTWSLVYWNLLL